MKLIGNVVSITQDALNHKAATELIILRTVVINSILECLIKTF